MFVVVCCGVCVMNSLTLSVGGGEVEGVGEKRRWWLCFVLFILGLVGNPFNRGALIDGVAEGHIWMDR